VLNRRNGDRRRGVHPRGHQDEAARRTTDVLRWSHRTRAAGMDRRLTPGRGCAAVAAVGCRIMWSTEARRCPGDCSRSRLAQPPPPPPRADRGHAAFAWPSHETALRSPPSRLRDADRAIADRAEAAAATGSPEPPGHRPGRDHRPACLIGLPGRALWGLHDQSGGIDALRRVPGTNAADCLPQRPHLSCI
jgi:hypothetical protein